MSAWDELTGQEAAIRALQEAAADPDSMTHSWLITGPPGSGRSNLAYAFATALLSGLMFKNSTQQRHTYHTPCRELHYYT